MTVPHTSFHYDHDYARWSPVGLEVLYHTHDVDRHMSAPVYHALCWAAADTINWVADERAADPRTRQQTLTEIRE